MESIRIGGITYRFEIVSDLRDGDKKLDGLIQYRPFSIQLDADLGAQGTQMVLWHEILHGILAHAGRCDEVDENVLDTLAYGIVQVLRDNEEFKEVWL